MALFKLKENRFIDTNHVADISYAPANWLAAVIMLADAKGIPTAPVHRNPSYLHIDLKSLESIQLESYEADAAWAAFKKASKRRGNSKEPETQRQKTIRSFTKGNLDIQKRLKKLIEVTNDPKIRQQAETQLKAFQRTQKRFPKR